MGPAPEAYAAGSDRMSTGAWLTGTTVTTATAGGELAPEASVTVQTRTRAPPVGAWLVLLYVTVPKVLATAAVDPLAGVTLLASTSSRPEVVL